MRGCLTFIITAIILVAFGGTALAAIVVLVPILLGDQDAESLSLVHLGHYYLITNNSPKASC